MHLHFHLDRFDGPLGLLLFLIRKEEMDIFDINIHEITEQYLSYIKSFKNLDLEMAGEFVAMAATLIHIKSKMLLPNYNESNEDEPTEDPRKSLVQKLLEYEKFKSAAQQLNAMPLLNRDLWTREEKVDLSTYAEEEIEVSERPLFSLIHAYRATIGRVKKTVHKVGLALQSIAQRINEIKNLLRVGARKEFNELLLADGLSPEMRQGKVLITFLSLLELAKMGFIQLFQNDKEAPIYVDAKKEIVDELLIGIEDYENPNEKRTAATTGAGVWDQLNLDEQSIGTDAQEETDSAENSYSLVEDSTTQNEFATNNTDLINTESNLSNNFENNNDGFVTSMDFNPLNLMEMPTKLNVTKIKEELIEEEIATDEEILAAELELEALEKESNFTVSSVTEVILDDKKVVTAEAVEDISNNDNEQEPTIITNAGNEPDAEGLT